MFETKERNSKNGAGPKNLYLHAGFAYLLAATANILFLKSRKDIRACLHTILRFSLNILM